ncbi:MAG: molybdenum cofactor biosynthesis protein MoeB [Euryarchaeota archaeon]|nr:molybdenum cofactor biosynthesis protein MoeB [Euryarchaeota archaeon]|tara:strand:+ start:1995 stop:3164 length:1170 start_codon:yes stop_codon:yes gene_type:complete
MVDVERHARHLSLPTVGVEGQSKLDRGRVLIIGAGGLGSPAALYLAAAGVGHIGLVDDDIVDLSNLQRQILHTTKSVGTPKVHSARDRIHALDSGIKVSVFNTRFNPGNATELLELGWDLVIDGTDNIPTRYLLDDVCLLNKTPWVYGSVFQFEGQVSVFGYKGGPSYRDLFPDPPPSNAVPSCEEAGVFGVLPGVIGLLQATEAIKMLLELEVALAGSLLIYDAMKMSFTSLSFGVDPERLQITDLESSSAMFDSSEWCSLDSDSNHGDIEKEEAYDVQSMFNHISVSEALERRSTGWKPFVLDVRSDAEYVEAHAASCDLQVPHDQVLSVLEQIPENRDILVYCRSGMRSQLAAMSMLQAGFNAVRVYNLDGGIIAWKAAAPDEIVN